MTVHQRHNGRQAALETEIMDLAESGLKVGEIAERLEISPGNARRILGYMSESSAERTFHRDLVTASARLVAAIAAIAATGRGYA